MAKSKVIETSGESAEEKPAVMKAATEPAAEPATEPVAEPVAGPVTEPVTEPAPEAPEASAAGKAAEGAAESASAPPDKDVLAATVAMAQAASESSEKSIEIADKMSRDLLIRTISFQLPPEWITEETAERIEKIDTGALAMVLSWLALNWWAGYEIGRNDTLYALKVAASKGAGDPEKVAVVEEQIKRERAEAEAAGAEGGE